MFLLFSCPVSCPDTEAGTLNYKPEREKDQPMRLRAQEYSVMNENLVIL